MQKVKFIVLILLIIIFIYISFKVLLLYFSTPTASIYYMTSIEPEKRGTPPYKFVIDKKIDFLPHIRLFFWVPTNSYNYNPFADDGVKTNVLGHGTVDKWTVKETEIVVEDEKLVFLYVPKTFMFLYGKDFYKLIHLYYK